MGETNPGHGRRGAAKVKHAGRRSAKTQRYYDRVYIPRKIRHMLKNNGYKFAWAWACKRNVTHMMPKDAGSKT